MKVIVSTVKKHVPRTEVLEINGTPSIDFMAFASGLKVAAKLFFL